MRLDYMEDDENALDAQSGARELFNGLRGSAKVISGRLMKLRESIRLTLELHRGKPHETCRRPVLFIRALALKCSSKIEKQTDREAACLQRTIIIRKFEDREICPGLLPLPVLLGRKSFV